MERLRTSENGRYLEGKRVAQREDKKKHKTTYFV
jgi:hypothetical protein